MTSPSFPALVRLHLRLLVREFPVAWIVTSVLGLLMLWVTLLILLEDPSSLAATEVARVRFEVTATGMTVVVFLLALLWPEAVWRNLPPGGRDAVDSLPVTRLRHRMARVTAGAFLPLGAALVVVVMVASLQLRPHLAAPSGEWPSVPPITDPGWLTAAGAVVAIYLIGSILALRLGGVLLPFLLFWGTAAVVVAVLQMGFGWREGAAFLARVLFLGSWAPGQLFMGPGGTLSNPSPLPAWSWAAASLTVCLIAANRRG